MPGLAGRPVVSRHFDRAAGDLVADNRRNWDARAPVHRDSDHYDLSTVPAQARFHPREWEQLGSLAEASVLHLQCHNGVETIAFAERGAKVTGLDFSSASLAVAREVADEAGVRARFVEADVHDAVEALTGETFDVVYTGRGSLMYLPDLSAWAEVVARLVKPGGLFYLMEYHPLLCAVGLAGSGASRSLTHPLELRYDYLGGGGPASFDTPVTYAPSRSGRPVEGATVSHLWAHSVVEVIGALSAAGLTMDPDMLWETDWVNEPRWDGMVPMAPGWWRRPDGGVRIPLMYALGARRSK
ncbi:class I SAM-dependent methyltransferase [Streptomyces djakartensis]|uniref:class I SAM-dependent methyltransferase n=1 Tax=Streptomyces djakartensis TaxID=68193 RepID=UPI003F8063C4